MAIGRTRRRTSILSAPPHEMITLKTSSGWSLAVELREPTGPIRGTAILLHPMMASRRVWNSPRENGVVGVLYERGVRTLALDFRGHGESGPSASKGGVWRYDDLVAEDLPALCRAVREHWPSDRVTIVGHSLGGHVALASLAAGSADADSLAILATNVWLPSEEPNPITRARKAALVRVCEVATRARGYFPARALGVGSDDEAGPFMRGWTSWWRRDRWTSEDERTDYLEAMSTLRLPILAIASLGDVVYASPANAFRFVQRASRASVGFELVRRADDGAPAPDHMQLVTTRAAVSAWHKVAEFAVGR